MKSVTALGIIGITVAAVVAQVRPWLPGPHDPAAIGLSWAMQILAWASILLAPLGVARGFLADGGGRIWTAFAVGLCVTIGAAMAIAALVQGGASLAGLLALTLTGSGWALLRLPPRMQAAALVLAPGALAVAQFAFLPQLEAQARRRAMNAAGPLIADIRAHERRHGSPPHSLLAVWPDYGTGAVGVAPHRYERLGATWQIVFEVPRRLGPTRTLAVYTPTGRWIAHSHAAHRATLPPVDDQGGRGWFAQEPGDCPDWRLFHFD